MGVPQHCLLALALCCWCPSPPVGTEQSSRQLWSHRMPFGSWRGIGCSQAGSNRREQLIFPAPRCGLWVARSRVSAWQSCVLLTAGALPVAQAGAWLWGSREPLSPAQPSRQAHTAMPSAPGGAERRSGSGVTLFSCFSAMSGAVLPCTRVQLRLCAAGLWLIQQLWGPVLGGRAVPILQPQPSPATPCREAQGSSRKHRRRLGHGHVAGDAFAMSL